MYTTRIKLNRNFATNQKDDNTHTHTRARANGSIMINRRANAKTYTREALTKTGRLILNGDVRPEEELPPAGLATTTARAPLGCPADLRTPDRVVPTAPVTHAAVMTKIVFKYFSRPPLLCSHRSTRALAVKSDENRETRCANYWISRQSRVQQNST